MNHRWNAGLTALALMLGAVVLSVDTKKPRPVEPPLEAPVPMQEATTDAGVMRVVVGMGLPGKLPTPGPNQKKAGTCDPEQAQVEINGGCWLETTTPPPCPRGKQWEHEGRCWLPVAFAKPPPTSGEPRRPGGVAGP